MKITLINVQISEGNNIVPPLGILYIASVLERMGHELQVFDIDPDVTLWIVPFLCFYPNYAWILLTGLIMLSYHVLIRYMADGIWMESM